ncbi:hypothetical protein PZB74_12255 [Porifericola rhodea]|uniref:endonuclease/exonuclease/phosphatase family protein n=1 Tax=Porifericola rhodea TaxID=930972 RepID=UPI0026664DEB|nr:hypothetical protein [Porifericola rhodea]WKN29738.1 hypothetical protein PZB74_12255 [Porifericola rhodea]
MKLFFVQGCKPAILALLLSACASQVQEETSASQPSGLRICFYNVEQLYDIHDDPAIEEDADYLPSGKKQWTDERYQAKLDKIVQVIAALNMPEVIGLAEIENGQVLRDIVKHEKLSDYSYEIIHFDTPPPNSLDVALLYRSVFFTPYLAKAVNVPADSNGHRPPDILQVSGILGERSNMESNTIHLLITDWPDRQGGMSKSEEERLSAAHTLRQLVNDILANDEDANIVVMGTFNDEPDNKSFVFRLGAHGETQQLNTGDLYNPMYKLDQADKGSYYSRSSWKMLDQILISQSLLDDRKGSADFVYRQGSAQVFDTEWLLQTKGNTQQQPYPTYEGFEYKGGYSDHLPVYIDLQSDSTN